MAIEKKERYIVELKNGTRLNIVASSYQECLQMEGEENVCMMKKLDYEEAEHE